MSLIFHNEQKIKYSGNYTYEFVLECKKEESAVCALIVSATCQKLPIPVKCKWKRLIDKREYTIPTKTSNVYQPSCEDIRSRIIVEVEPIDPHDGQGIAIATTPKLLLDGIVRSNLENILHQGRSKFPVSYLHEAFTDRVMDARLEITKSMLKLDVLTSEGNLNEEHSFQCSYSIGFPSVQLHMTDCKRLFLILDEGKGRITLQCLSRTSRDLIVMCLRVFSIETYLLHSKALENICSGQPPFSKIEVALELNEVVLQLAYLSKENSSLKAEKARYKKEMLNLENEMQSTIEAYQSSLYGRALENEDKSEKIRNEELLKIKDELDSEINSKHKLRKKIKKREEEIKNLLKKIEELQESQQDLVWELKESRDSILDNDVSEYESKIQDLQNEVKKRTEMLQEVLDKSLNLSVQKDHLEKEISDKCSEIEKLRGDIIDHSSLLQELSQMKNQNEALLGQRGLLSKRIENLQLEFQELQQKHDSYVQTAKESIQRIEEENKKLRYELEKINEEKKDDDSSALKEEVIKYRTQCDSLAAQISRLQAQLRRNK